jgi:phosphoglycolate phosphatase
MAVVRSGGEEGCSWSLIRREQCGERITLGNMSNDKNGKVRAILFDLDGTLIDSKLDIVNSVNAMLRATRREEMSIETVAAYIGHGAPRLVASVLGVESTENERATALNIFLEHYAEHSLGATRAYPGVEEALALLKGNPMAVLTNKPTSASLQILEGLGLAKYFQGIYGGDSFEKKKPDPSGAQFILRELGAVPEESAMVGDSDVDVQTARNAGMRAIVVKYGFGRYDSEANPADQYIDRLTELVKLAKGKQWGCE